MSIIQISKIQVRSGNLEDLPQLSVGELGWATDAKRLFIGGDPNTIGPIPDNTEILTVLSPNIVSGAAGNTGEIQFNVDGTFTASPNLTWDGTTLTVIGDLSASESTVTGNSVVVGNISTSGILTNNYYYANGAPVDFEQPAGANTQIQFNNNNNFGATAGLTFNSDTNNLQVTGNALIGNVRTQYILGTEAGSNLVLTTTGVDSSVTVVPTGLGSLDVSFKRITSLATPITDSDAATKLYVDEVAQGLKIKQSVVCGSVTDLPAYTYDNGASGVGATITASAPGALVLDGITPTAGSRVLIKNESAANAPYNGIYNVTVAGAVGTAFVLTRTLDFDGDNSTGGEVAGAFTFVQSGTTLADSGWVCTTNNPVVIGTTDLNFSQFSGAGTYLAGPGLTLTGRVFSVNVDNDTTEITPQGNVIVKPSANFVTPNIGDAVGNSLTLTGNTVTDAILTDNYFYANGAPVDFQQPAGANTQIQFNDQNNFGASSNFTFNTASNILTVGGNIITGNISGTTGTFSSVAGSGARLSSLNASNISTGTIAQVRLANSSLTVNGTVLTLGGTSTITANAETLTGTTLNPTVVNSSLTSVGTLGSLAVTGDVTTGNVSGTTGAFTSVTGSGAALTSLNASNISSGTLDQARLANSSLTINGSTLTLGGTSTITANAETLTGISLNSTIVSSSLTSVGTLGSLAVTGNVTTGNVSGTTGAFTSVTGSGAGLTTLNASNISSGTLDQARLANSTLTVNGSTLTLGGTSTITAAAGTLTGTTLNSTVVSSSLTSVGTLGSLAVTGTTTSGAVQTTSLTTGAVGTGGTITGVWTLNGASRMEATYADLAERYTSDKQYEPGTILMIDGEQEVTIANYDGRYRLAGIVSTAPAYVLNSTIQDSVIIALVGRVPCRVRGKINRGDLITISDVPGVGTAIEAPAPGVIVGRALEAYDSDEIGMIEVKVDR